MITFIVASSAVMVIHCCNWFDKDVSCEELLGGGGVNTLKHLYHNDYAEVDSKISYMMILHDYLLACEISMVRNLALRIK